MAEMNQSLPDQRKQKIHFVPGYVGDVQPVCSKLATGAQG